MLLYVPLLYNIGVESKKTCPRCKELKALSEFNKSQSMSDGLQSYCRHCSHTSNRNWASNNPERRREIGLRWRANNPEKYKENGRRWRVTNPEEQKKYMQRWRKNHPEYMRQYQAENLTPTYASWSGMLSRCRNPKVKGYKYYGGRGITICTRWDNRKGGSFANFLFDMGERPKGTSIDRINNNGNYEPSNCRWATWSEQMSNRRKWKTKEVTNDQKEAITSMASLLR